MLHSFDSGEWGKHQWPLLLKILTASEQAHLSKKFLFNSFKKHKNKTDSFLFSIDKTPHWWELKHFKAVTSTEFTDGNSYKDILKVCIIVITITI